jgi:hypothetical protein
MLMLTDYYVKNIPRYTPSFLEKGLKESEKDAKFLDQTSVLESSVSNDTDERTGQSQDRWINYAGHISLENTFAGTGQVFFWLVQSATNTRLNSSLNTVEEPQKLVTHSLTVI